MTTPLEEAAAYLSKLRADQEAAITESKQKAQEAMLIKAREDGFREAMAIFGPNVTGDDTSVKTFTGQREKRRDIRQMIMQELSFSAKPMSTEQIARAIHYIPERTATALNRLENSGKICQNRDGYWEVDFAASSRLNGHATAA